MTVFVDTSALIAALVADDPDHGPVREALELLLDRQVPLVTSSYVVIETSAVLQRRIGLGPVRALHERLVPVLDVVWVDERVHDTAYRALTVADRRPVSLVDWTSFEIMRRRAIRQALTLDGDFAAQDFEVLP
jgi:predicted nucleic acid-binding protein